MTFSLFDQGREQLFPLTLTRPTAMLRVGILTIQEKWENHLKSDSGIKTDAQLQPLFKENGETNLQVNGRCLPSNQLVNRVKQLDRNHGLKTADGIVVAAAINSIDFKTVTSWETVDAQFITYPEDVFVLNGGQIEQDFKLVTASRSSQPLSDTNTVTGPGTIFLEEGARVEGTIINPDGGVVYIGKDAEIMEGSVIRGSLAMCEHAVLKLSSKIYGATTLGPYCKVGGEVNNSVLIGYSNKGHDGFLGNSVLGEWCNIGADSNNSNLKNNYADVKLWDYASGRFRNTGRQFCGLIMGDHSKCGINTMFNTGTVVGVSANIYGSGFPRNYVPSFAWGGASGFSTYQINKAFETMERVMDRRGKTLTEEMKDFYRSLFELTAQNRFWELNKTKSSL